MRWQGNTERDINIRTTLLETGLTTNMMEHFKRRRIDRNSHTWKGIPGRPGSCCDYIISSHRSMWRRIQLRTPRRIRTDHKLIVGTLFLEQPKIQRVYWQQRRKSPFESTGIQRAEPRTTTETMYQQLLGHVEKQKGSKVDKHLDWVSERTWKHIRERADIWRNFQHHTSESNQTRNQLLRA